MALTTYTKVRLLTNISTSDISDANITSMISEATKELNRMINTKVVREQVSYIDSTRENTIDSSNTTFYVRNWEGKYLADMNNDGSVTTSDIIVYLVDSNGTETTPTISSIDHDDGKFTLTSAPTSGYRMYITYEYSYKDVSTPDPIVELACTFLTASYCYAKLNIGRSPSLSFGSKRITRDMDSSSFYYKKAMDLISTINEGMYAYADSTETF